MRRVTALLLNLALLGLVALPAFAQGDDDPIDIDFHEQNNSGILGGATLSENGDTAAVYLAVEGIDPEGEYPAHIHAGECAQLGAIMHPLEPVVHDPETVIVPAGESVTFLDAPIEEILSRPMAIDVHLYSDPSVTVSCGNLPVLGGDQQVPDNEQGGGATFIKTFELTINGTVPADQVFAVKYGQQQEGDTRILVFCGAMEELADFPGYEAHEDCVGDGTVYTESVELPQDSVLNTTITRYHEGVEENFFTSNDGETLDADMTNTAWYTFGKDTGAGDDQHIDQQDDTQDDVQNDQQGETPEELPDTGAGGLATDSTIPVGNTIAAFLMLSGAGYTVLCRR